MSIEMVIELCFHLSSFRNVDLHDQGLYRIGIETYQHRAEDPVAFNKDSNPKDTAVAIPYSVFPPYKPKKSTANGVPVQGSDHLALPPKIIDEDHIYLSNAFLIRYKEETVEINEGVHFRLCLNNYKYLDAPVNVVAYLLKVDVKDDDKGKPQRLPLPSAKERSKMTDHNGDKVRYIDGFQVISQRDIILNRIGNGIHEFIPLNFDDVFSIGFALAELMVHSSVVSYKFVKLPLSTKPNALRINTFVDFLFRSYFVRHFNKNPDDPFMAKGAFYNSKIVNHPKLVEYAERHRTIVFSHLIRSYRSLRKACELLLSVSKQYEDPEDYDNLKTQLNLQHLEYHPKIASLRGVKLNDSIGSIGDDTVQYPVDCTPTLFCELLTDELNHVSATLFIGWNQFIEELAFSERHLLLVKTMKTRWEANAMERAGESIVRESCNALDLLLPHNTQLQSAHNKTAAALRRSVKFSTWEPMPVEDKAMFEDSGSNPIIFELEYLKESPSAVSADGVQVQVNAQKASKLRKRVRLYQDIHLVVLVHGFMGNSWDLRMFRDYLSMLEPSNVMCLLSTCNENNTDKCIKEMGLKLAKEVHNHISLNCSKKNLIRLSFVSHSIGSIIVRQALSSGLLQAFQDCFYTFFSLSSPHLGSRGGQSVLVNMGLNMIRRWKSSTALEQLSMLDHKDLYKTHMYQLSEQKGFEYFQHLVLISGHQDRYVPFHSARIEVPTSTDNKDVFAKMASNLLSPLMQPNSKTTVTKFDLSFDFDTNKKRRIDHFIGRAAHVQFLDSPVLTMMLLLHYKDKYFGL